mmetsp:Transcript_3923/g.5697  ORF Transcript_3923/g.5697 Transcript_3923/m.5697 type:complete len:99 (-) Transcript_3923:914-1210(-)
MHPLLSNHALYSLPTISVRLLLARSAYIILKFFRSYFAPAAGVAHLKPADLKVYLGMWPDSPILAQDALHSFDITFVRACLSAQKKNASLLVNFPDQC